MSRLLSSLPAKMIARKPFAAICPCCSVHYSLPGQPRTARVPPFYNANEQMPKQRPTTATVASRRTFATMMDDDDVFGRKTERSEASKNNQHDRHHGRHRSRHRHAWPKSKNPTPYEIFDLDKGDLYNKARFYDLVKMYHPDSHHHHHPPAHHLHGISPATMLERYRLVVSANDILSHPSKRRAYDLYGAGWASDGDSTTSTATHDIYRRAEDEWRRRPRNAAMNATWEDWERWHYEQAGGEKQEPQFMSNGSFVGVVVVLVVMASWVQFSRVGSSSMSLLEMRDENHQTIRKTLLQQQSENALLSREDRVGVFLERREGWGYALPATPKRGHTSVKNEE